MNQMRYRNPFRPRHRPIGLVLLVLATLFPASAGCAESPQDVQVLTAKAEAGDAKAQFHLGAVYAAGTGVLQDYVQAHKWYNLAASRGNAEAASARDKLAARMTPAQVSEAQKLARKWGPAAKPKSRKSRSAARAPSSNKRELVRRIQTLLARIGLDPGPADGMMGAKTRNAIRQFQADAGLLVNGRPTEELRQRLVAVAGRKGPGSAGTETWPQPVPGVVVTDTMLRSAPAADSANEGATKLGAGARVFVDARKGQWLRLRVDERDGRTGWASFPAIKLIRARATARTSPATADTPKSSGGLFSGIADFSRAATGLFSGDNVDSGNSGSGRTTATIGMRGLGAESLASARPRFDQVKLMDKYRADTKAARRHARVAGLTASNVAFLPEPSVQFQPSASPGEDNWEDGN